MGIAFIQNRTQNLFYTGCIMKHRNLSITLFILIAAVVSPWFASAQNSLAQERMLSQLRGTWDAHTFYDRWTMIFETDHSMYFDKQHAQYALLPGTLRIKHDKDSVDYQYSVEGKNLTLTLPDGSQRTYKKSNPGDAEKLLQKKTFYAVDSLSPEGSITFDGDHSFTLYEIPIADSTASATPARYVNVTGMYRVENNSILLTFDDGSLDEALVKAMDQDNVPASIAFDSQLLETEKPVVAASSSQPNTVLSSTNNPIYDPQPYVGPVYVPVEPQPYPQMPTAGALTPAKSSGSANTTTPRPVGSTREGTAKTTERPADKPAPGHR